MAGADEAGSIDVWWSEADEPAFPVGRRKMGSKEVPCVVRFRSFTGGLVPPPDLRLTAMSISVFTIEVVNRVVPAVDNGGRCRQCSGD